MKFSLSVLSLAVAVSALGLNKRADCNGNNCNRAVTGTRRGPGFSVTASSDCSSFLLTIVTPAVVTVKTDFTTTTTAATSTTFLIPTATIPPSKRDIAAPLVARGLGRGPILGYTDQPVDDKRDLVPAPVVRRQQTAAPTAIPAYASPCADAAAYASACSCLGVTAATTTLAAATTTVFTATVTTTVTPVKTAYYCSSDDPNYYVWSQGGIQNGPNQQGVGWSYITLANQSPYDCCVSCANYADCGFYSIDVVGSGTCRIIVASSGSAIDGNPPPTCPHGVTAYTLGTGDTSGIGPCGVNGN